MQAFVCLYKLSSMSNSMRMLSLLLRWLSRVRVLPLLSLLPALMTATPAGAADVEPASLSLAQAQQMALQRNHDLRLSGYAVDSAKAAAVMAAAAPNPTLSVQTANINPKAGIGAGGWRSKTVDTTVQLSQLIERGGKRELRQENAAHLENAARSDLQDVQRQVRVAVAQAYYDVLAAQEKQAVVQHTAQLYDATIDAARKRLKAGDIASADVARLQVDALRAQNDVAQAGAEVTSARQVLGLLLGVSGKGDRPRLSDSWPAAAFNRQDIPDEVIERRPDVVAAKARVEAAKSARKLALALRTRDVTVGLQYEHYPTSDTNALGSGNSYGVSVQIPLFVRYAYDGEIRSAEAGYDMALENLEKIRDQARSDLIRSWSDAHAAYDRIDRYEQRLLTAAKQAADAAEFAFKHGAIGVMDVLDARRTWRATQLDAVAARNDYAKSLAAWQAAALEREYQ